MKVEYVIGEQTINSVCVALERITESKSNYSVVRRRCSDGKLISFDTYIELNPAIVRFSNMVVNMQSL